MQGTNAELLKEIDRLDRQIKDEQQRAVQLRTELRNGSRSNTLVHEVGRTGKKKVVFFLDRKLYFS